MKQVESHNSITTTTESKPEIDLRPYIKHAFHYGPRMKEFIKERHLNTEEWHKKLGQNEIFTVKMLTKLHGEPEESYPDLIEAMLLEKLEKTLEVCAQEKRC